MCPACLRACVCVGAFGHFLTTRDCSAWTKADFLQGAGTHTPVAARFSTTTFGREFPDEARNPRGLAFKFYTKQGNYDIMSINFPAFFVRSVQRSQQSNALPAIRMKDGCAFVLMRVVLVCGPVFASATAL